MPHNDIESSEVKNKKILITGATGYLGSAISIKLINEGYKVIALKRSFSKSKLLNAVLDQVKFYDIDKTQHFKKCFELAFS